MKTPTAFVFIGLAIAVVLLGLILDWSAGIWAPLAVLLFALSGFAMTRGGKGGDRERATSSLK